QSFVRASSARRRFRLVVRRGSDKHADYVLVQHIQDFLRLFQGDSVQQFEANLHSPKCGNRVMVGANIDYDRPSLPANAKTNTCSFDLTCRHQLLRCEDVTFMHCPPPGRERRGFAPILSARMPNRSKLPTCSALGPSPASAYTTPRFFEEKESR